MAILLTWMGTPGTVRGDTIVLISGESIEGAIVGATRNTVVVRRAIGGMRQMRIQDIAEVRIPIQGRAIAGDLVGWVDGVHQIRSEGEILRIGAGRILTRERREQAAEPPSRSVPSSSPPPEPLAPRPAQGPTIETASAPAATAAEAPAVESERAAATPAPEPAVAKRASVRNGAALVTAGRGAKPEDLPALVAPALVRPPRIAAAPASVDPVPDHDREIAIAKDAAEASTAVIMPAAVTVPRPAAAVATAKTMAAEVAPAATDPAEDGAAISAGKTSPAEPPPSELEVAELTAPSPSAGDDQLLVVRGTVEPGAAGIDGIVFRIELSRPAEQTVVLIYGTVDGTAVAGKDYEPRQGVVALAPGSRSADVRVPLIEHGRPRDARFGLFLTADPKVAKVVDPWISATIPAAD